MASAEESPGQTPSIDPVMSHGFRPVPPRESDFDAEESDDNVPPLTADDRVYTPYWRCVECRSPNWRWMDGYRCEDCGCIELFEFYDDRQQQRSMDGSWIFVPSGASVPHPGGLTADASRVVPGPPSSPSTRSFLVERSAESETPTTDTCVNPDTMQPLSRKRRKMMRERDAPMGSADSARAQYNNKRQPDTGVAAGFQPDLGATATGGQKFSGGSAGNNDGLRAASGNKPGSPSDWNEILKQTLNEFAPKDSKDKDWSIMKGPQPGIKYRGGAAPQPPAWRYAKDDLRAFQKWERKVGIWQIQVSSYLPPNEAAMALYCSLRGEAEEELEWCDVTKINQADGIKYIIDTLRQPLMTKTVYLKRRYLHEYEYVQRAGSESARAFCNRYLRTERSLLSVGINVLAMYNSESRGARLLDRLRLGLEQQRLILVASGQPLQFDTIREAAQIQFPDHRPTPPVVYSREFDGRSEQVPPRPPPPGKGNRFQPSQNKGKGKGGKNLPSRAYVAAIPEDQEMEDDEYPEDEEEQSHVPEEDDPDAEASDHDPDDGEVDFSEVARVLTVTARRLQGLTLGRKFSGPQKSISQRKAESHCATCGQRGHWAGDRECPQANATACDKTKTSSKSGKGQPKGKANGDARGASKKVLTVTHPGGYQRKIKFNDTPEVNEGIPTDEHHGASFGCNPYQIQMVKVPKHHINQVYGNNMHIFNHYLVMDTACQRTCCSTMWLDGWTQHAHNGNYIPRCHHVENLLNLVMAPLSSAINMLYCFRVLMATSTTCVFLEPMSSPPPMISPCLDRTDSSVRNLERSSIFPATRCA